MLDFTLYVITVAAIYGLLSISLNLQAGVSGLLNFGHIAFFGVGAYATGIVAAHGGSWPIGIAVGMLCAALLGTLIGRLGRTLAADYWAIVTLAVAECLRLVATNQDSLTGGPQGISGVPGPFPGLSDNGQVAAWLISSVLVLLAAALFAHRLVRQQFGRVLRLQREQPLLAESLGHNVVGAKVRLMACAAPIAALGGSLYTMYITYIGPDQLAPSGTFLIFTMLVVGGLGNVWGSALGALVVQLIYSGSQFLRDVMPIPQQAIGSIQLLLIGLLLTAFLMLRPTGVRSERPRSFDAVG